MSSVNNNPNSAAGPGTSGAPDLRCPWCPFVATCARGLNIHTGNQHRSARNQTVDSSLTPPPTVAPSSSSIPATRSFAHQCQQCPFSSSSARGLKTHTTHKHKYDRPLTQPTLPVAASSGSATTDPRDVISPPAASVSPSLASLKQHLRVLPRIPHAARVQAARKFTHLLGNVAEFNNVEAWTHLLEFAYRVLHVSSAAGRKPLPTCVKDNISSYDRPLLLPRGKPRLRRRELSDDVRGRAAEERLASKGDLKGAMRLLSSSESLVSPHDLHAQQEMISKHPDPEENDIAPVLPSTRPPRACSVEEIVTALRSFPPGSSGGLDGLTAQHILDLIAGGGELRRLLLEKLARVCDIIARGRIPEDARHLVLGSWLVAASKSSGGLRPIAVGSTLRRLTAKVLLARVRSSAAAYLCPRQLGFATRGGAEIAVHSVRTFLHLNEKCTLLKIDFQNAFNSHRRDTMLKEVHERVPEIYPMVAQAYSSPTPISFGDMVINSRTGCQQGDVFSPLLFCLVVQKTLQSLESELAIGFLDDFTLMSGDPLKVLRDIERIQADHPINGLTIKPSKCEIHTQGASITEQADIVQRFSVCLPGSRVLPDEADLELLGAPIFEAGIPKALENKESTYELLFRRLQYVGSHVATYIVQRAAGVPKLTYLLRTSPVFRLDAQLSRLDNMFAACFESILKTSLSGGALIQLSLPTSMGGFGIPTPSNVALPAFAASCHASEADVFDILGAQTDRICFRDEAMSEFTAKYGSVPQPEDRATQSKWTKIAGETIMSSLRLQCSDSEADTIRLANASVPESGWWLQAMPSRNIGTLLNDRDFFLAACLRLGLPLSQECTCPCGVTVDRFGLHRLSCNSLASGRLARHAAINDLLSRAFRQAGVANSKEPRNLSADGGLRPDGITHEPWSRGRQLVWDVTVRDSYAASNRSIARSIRAVATKGEQEKSTKYQGLLESYIFAPFVIESTGVWGLEALKLVKELGRRIIAREGDKRAAMFIRQRIAVEVQRGNARMISGAEFGASGLRELSFLSG